MRKCLLYVCLLLTATSSFANKRFVPPTTPAGNITFIFLEGNSFRVNWNPGNGTRRIVVMRQGSAVTGVPVNGTDYNASTVFGNGDQLNAGEFIVYDNTSSFVDVSNLQPNTTYHVAIFEYNGTASATEYLITGAPAANQATLAAPVTAATNVVFSNVNGNSMTVSWTNGSGARRVVFVREAGAVNANPVDLTVYNGGTNFGTGTQLGAGNYSVFNSGNGSSVTITNLQPNTAYHVAVFEYNGAGAPVYLVTSPATGSQVTLSRPTVAASNITYNFIEGNGMRLNWTAGNGTRRIVVARAGSAVTAVPADGTDYTASNAFGNGDAIAPGEFVVYDNTSTFVDISGLQPNTIYHFRIYEYSGSGTNTGYLTASFANSSQATLSAPSAQPSNLVFSNVTGNSMTIGWTNGNGSQRLVVMKEATVVDAAPVDLTVYNSSTVFGSGTQLGAGNFAVFRATTGNSVTVTNLLPNTTYHIAVFELNGTSGPVYNTFSPLTGSQLTSARPTVAASNITYIFIEGGGMRLNWTAGNGTRRIVVARAGNPVTAVPADGTDYAASNTFGNGDAIAPGEFVVYDNNSTFVDLSGLQPNTTYHFRIFEYSGTGTNTAYLTAAFPTGSQSTILTPTIQSSNIVFSNVTGNSMTVSWTNGNGSQRLVVMKEGSAVDALPVNLTVYNSSTIFGSGTQLGTGNFTVFRATTGNSVTVTNLQPNTIYHIAVFDLNGTGGPVYNTTAPPVASQATTGRPTVAASNLTYNFIEGNALRINWTSGNGARRIIVARAASAVTALPADGTDYAASNTFGSGDALAPGEFVVYDNTGTFVDLSGLQPNTTYHFRIYEYSGTGATIAYLTTSFATGSQSTTVAPTIQASNISFSAVTGNSVTVGWTIGNGAQRLVVARQGSAVNANPVDLTIYSASPSFGFGTQIGSGNFAVYRSNGSNAVVSGLLPGTTYHFAVYEFNGSSAPVYLLPGLAGSTTTLGPPQVASSNATTGNITSSSMQISWSNGSGNRRMVLMKATTAVDATPVDNGTYTANSFFGSGTQPGTGNYVVFDGVGSTVTVTGLAASTTYHFAVFEYNAFGVNSQFLVAGAATGSAMTSVSLPVTFIDFTAGVNSSGIQLNWSTAQEQNSSYFDIQKSNDGRTFSSIGTVQAAGDRVQRTDYSFTDRNPFGGLNYYRLKQVDKDNQFIYSKIISLSYEPIQLVKRVVNPVHQTIVVELYPFNRNNTLHNQWYVYDLQGKRMAGGSINSTVVRADIPALKSGLYILEVTVNNKSEKIKIVKL